MRGRSRQETKAPEPEAFVLPQPLLLFLTQRSSKAPSPSLVQWLRLERTSRTIQSQPPAICSNTCRDPKVPVSKLMKYSESSQLLLKV